MNDENQDDAIRRAHAEDQVEMAIENLDANKLKNSRPINPEFTTREVLEEDPDELLVAIAKQWHKRDSYVDVELVGQAEAIRAKLLGADLLGVVLVVERSTKLIPCSVIVSMSLAA